MKTKKERKARLHSSFMYVHSEKRKGWTRTRNEVGVHGDKIYIYSSLHTTSDISLVNVTATASLLIGFLEKDEMK